MKEATQTRRRAEMKQIRIIKPKPARPTPPPIDTRTPSGRVLPY